MTPDRIDKWFDARLCEGGSHIHGRGLFVREPVRTGEILMRWGGILIPQEQYDPTRHRPGSASRWDETRYLVTPVGEPSTLDELLNHSCDPNAWMADERTVVARRPIAAGEEVTTDFSMWEDCDYLYTSSCRCGTSLCRSVITGLDWQSAALQARYEGHFLPHINRAIRKRGVG